MSSGSNRASPAEPSRFVRHPTSAPVRYVSLAVLLALMVILAVTLYQFLAPFLMPLFLAAVLALVCQPLYRRVVGWCRGNTSVAAGVTTGMLVLGVLIPALVGTFVAATQLVGFVQTYLSDKSLTNSDLWKDLFVPVVRHLADILPGYDEARVRAELSRSAEQLAKSLAESTFSLATSTAGALVSLLVALGMFLIALYFFLAEGPELLKAAERLIPVHVEHQRQLWVEFAKATRAVVMATFFAAFAQGVATALALQVLGFGHFLVFLLAAAFTALIPIAGTWMVWGPCAAWLAIRGDWGSAVGLALWGVLVVGLIDNVVRTYVLNSDAELHPLLAFVSVIGALQVMGLWGIFIGPIVACCLTSVVTILRQELNEILATPPPSAVAAAPPAAVAAVASAQGSKAASPATD